MLFTHTLPGTQRAFVTGSQVVAQAPLSQMKPWHELAFPVPEHIPLPLQVLVITWWSALQTFPQSVPPGANLHTPAPLHLPTVPQGSMVVSSVQLSGSDMPLPTWSQTPFMFAQLWHVPQDGLEQHVLSTQLLLAHSLSLAHWAPSKPLPQLPVAVSQALPLHSASDIQVVRQALLESHL